MKPGRPDRVFFILTAILALAGFIIFSSAAMGLLNQDGPSFGFLAGKQLFILLLGLAAALIVSSIPYHRWQKFSPYLFGLSLILTLLIFVDGLSLSAGGARRWLLVPGGFSFQPAEFLKLGAVLFWAWWLSRFKDRVGTWRYGFLPLLGLLAGLGGILLAQPNTSALIIIGVALVGMFMIAGGKWRHFFLLGLIGFIALASVALTRPYVLERVYTFLDSTRDVTGESYQITRIKIAVGSGGLLGRGFGQSVQKFNYLPEPTGDSIFAVAAEEFGLVGMSLFLFVLMAFILWGLKISARAAEPFGRLTAGGIVILMAAQSFINIGAMLELFPLTGVPLVFVSQGGSALLLALVEAGIILNISRYRLTA